MNEIRTMTREEIPAYVELIAGSYPTMDLTTPEKKEHAAGRMVARLDELPVECSYVGAFDGVEMVGGMIVYPFTMNWRGAMVPAGGVGMIATSLMHRREHIARDMIRWFVEEERDRGAVFALLYPFSTAFYHRMGFGFSSLTMRYELIPGLLPKTGDRSLCQSLTEHDIDLVRDHCNRVVRMRNGMLEKREFELKDMLAAPGRVVGVQQGSQITALLRFSFGDRIDGNFLAYDLLVSELSYETPAALQAILSCIGSLSDQVRRVRIDTQNPEFYHVVDDPRDTSGTLLGDICHRANQGGVGLMIRLTGQGLSDELLASAQFGLGTVTVSLDIAETLTSVTTRRIGLCFEGGRAAHMAAEQCASRVQLGVADASSLLTGAVSLQTLVQLGRAEITPDSELERINHIFRTDVPPVCTTEF